MEHTPFGYRIENGIAVVDKENARKIRKLYVSYLSGLSLAGAAKEAGIEIYHCSAKRIMRNRHYLGDDFYPAIIDADTFRKAEEELESRAEKLGRKNRRKETAPQAPPTRFSVKPAEKHFNDPVLQAEYLYGQIESEADSWEKSCSFLQKGRSGIMRERKKIQG
jgi:hypothetical protein